MAEVEVTRDDDARRWVATLDGAAVGELVWRDGADGLPVLVHTGVEDAAEGRGVGGALARTALDDLVARDQAFRVTCPFVRAWLDRHPDHPAHALER